MQSKQSVKEFVINMLKTKFPLSYSYHSYHHILFVGEKAVEIAEKEKCTDLEISLLCAPALWHNRSHIYEFINHEEKSR